MLLVIGGFIEKYYPPTRTGHLAWAISLYRQSYFVPGSSLHFFLFFGPYFVMFKRRFLQITALLIFITGPVFSTYLTPSVNEQPAIWCLYSVVQTAVFGIVVRWKELYKQPIPNRIHHPGFFGEKPLTYYAVSDACNVEEVIEV